MYVGVQYSLRMCTFFKREIFKKLKLMEQRNQKNRINSVFAYNALSPSTVDKLTGDMTNITASRKVDNGPLTDAGGV